MSEHGAAKVLAVAVALIMVVSMLAPAAGASSFDTQQDLDGDTTETGVQSNLTEDGLPEQQQPDTVAIDPALTDLFANPEGDGSIDVVVRLPPAETSQATTRQATVDTLKDHAIQTQQPIVRFAEMSDHVELKQQFWITNAVLLEVNPDRVSLDEIAAVKGVEKLHTNFEITTAQANTSVENSSNASPTDQADASVDSTPVSMQSEDYETTYGLEMINATEVWDTHNTQGAGVKVAVLDTGMDDSHPDLPELDDEHWQSWDSDGNPVDSEPSDSSGHGTHVSGTVAGAEEPAGDVPTFGVAPDVELYHGQVIPGGSGSFTQVAAGMEWAVDDAGADIISMSLGAEGYFTEMIEPSENARDAGVILVASAGNSYEGSSGSPGNVYPNFASGAVDENYDVAGFSGGETVDTDSAWGSEAPDYWPEEYVVPNAAAPGVDVLSSVPGGGYDGTYSGTSMSAPHKAGAFALMLSAAGGDLDRETAIETMEDTAWKPDDWDEPDDEPDIRYGYGIIDVAAAADQVALDSGVTGTVTDSSGTPVAGVTVEIPETGFTGTTNDDGEYTVLSPPGNYTVTAGGFGYEETNASVEIPDNETFVQQNFTLEDALGVSLAQGQPAAAPSGQSFTIQVTVANLEAYEIVRAGDYDGNLTVTLNGDQIPLGEELDLDGLSGTANVTVTTENDTAGSLALEHTFTGPDSATSVTTGPTNVFAEYIYIGVVDDGTYGDDVVTRLQETLPASYDISLIDGQTAVNASASGEYDGYVVQNIDAEYVEPLKANTENAAVGIVWLDQWGSSSDGITTRSAVLDDPASTDDSFSTPYPSMEITADNPLFEGVGEVGDSFQLHEATFADHSWFSDTDFTVVGQIQAGGVTDGGGAAVNQRDREVMLATMGSTFFVGGDAYTEEANTVLGNAAAWAAEPPPAYIKDGQPVHVGAGDPVQVNTSVENLAQVKVSLHEDSTASEEDLTLYLNGSVNAFDQWRAYEPALTERTYPITVTTTEDTVGSVILEMTFEFTDGESLTYTTGPTAVFDRPLTVGPEADVPAIQDAVDLAPDGTDIVVNEGTYNETVSVDSTTGLTITGTNATIQPPANASADTHVSITANDTTLSGVAVETPSALVGVGVNGATDVSLTDLSVTGGSDAVQVVGSSAVTITDVTASDAGNIGIHAAGTDNVAITDVSALQSTTGLRVAESTNATVTDATVETATTGLTVERVETATITDGTITDVNGTGLSVSDSAGVSLTDSTLTDVTTGVAASGGAVQNISGLTVADATHGLNLTDGVAASQVVDNELTNVTTGLNVAGYGTSGEVALNDIQADTGLHIANQASDLTVHFNDLAETETAVVQADGESFDASLNWFGPAGPHANENVVGPAQVSPFLTSPPTSVDPDTTDIAVELAMEAGGTYTVGVPGPTNQTVGDLFADDFAGAIYGYDPAGSWEMLTADDSVASMSALLVTAEESGHVTLNFQRDTPAAPGEQQLEPGWNLVSPAQYTTDEQAFTEGDLAPSSWMQAYEHPSDHLGAYTSGEAAVNPFGGYWVSVPNEDASYTLFGAMAESPSIQDYYQQLNVSSGSTGSPEDVSVAVVDEENYHEDALTDLLSENLDESVYTSVETVTADSLLDEMDSYDVFVVQRFGSESLASSFQDNLAADQAVVYLDSYQGATAESYADGVYRLTQLNDMPADRESVATDADGEPVEVDIQSSHPIFDGVGQQGESVTVVDSGITWGSWFTGYDGQVLGHADYSASVDGEHEGPAVAVNPTRNEVLNTALGMDFFHDDPDDYTDAGTQLLVNSVEEAAGMTVTSAADASEDEQLAEDSPDDSNDQQDRRPRANMTTTPAVGASS